MMFFLTSNTNKYREAQNFLPDLQQQTGIELPEIQSLDHQEVTQHKLDAARAYMSDPFFVEDTSLHFEALNGFPWPFIKHMIKSIGVDGIRDLMRHQDNKAIMARCTIGYRDGEQSHIIVGECPGILVAPRGDVSFGRDPVFQPLNADQTFAEMTAQQKNNISHRAKAMQQLGDMIQQGE